MHGPAILNQLRSRQAAMIAELGRLGEHESPSPNKPALDNLARILAERLRGLRGTIEIANNPDGGNHLVGRFPGPPDRRPALVLGHFDTVWPIGTRARMPVRQEGSRFYGPGVLDMKASLVMMNAVLEAFNTLNLKLPRPLTVILTSDEEIGSPSSRSLIEIQAKQSAYVLVLEPPLADGSLKTARKGVGRFTIEIEGKAAHAGVAPENGVSAILELAYQILRIHSSNDSAAGTTLNVGVVHGGSAPNVVPAWALAEVDVRAATTEAALEVERAIRSLEPMTPGNRITVNGSFTRPPMERTPAVAALFAQAREIGRGLGLELTEGSTGGGSDGNFTAALGVPTLDGLGARGGGAHAADEHVLVDSLAERAALLGALLLDL
jgi:glutamate carboxypeptidase